MTDLRTAAANAHSLLAALDAPWAYRGASSMHDHEPRDPDHPQTTPATFRVDNDRLLVMYERDNPDAYVESTAWADLYPTR